MFNLLERKTVRKLYERRNRSGKDPKNTTAMHSIKKPDNLCTMLRCEQFGLICCHIGIFIVECRKTKDCVSCRRKLLYSSIFYNIYDLIHNFIFLGRMCI